MCVCVCMRGISNIYSMNIANVIHIIYTRSVSNMRMLIHMPIRIAMALTVGTTYILSLQSTTILLLLLLLSVASYSFSDLITIQHYFLRSLFFFAYILNSHAHTHILPQQYAFLHKQSLSVCENVLNTKHDRCVHTLCTFITLFNVALCFIFFRVIHKSVIHERYYISASSEWNIGKENGLPFLFAAIVFIDDFFLDFVTCLTQTVSDDVKYLFKRVNKHFFGKPALRKIN